MMRCLGCAYDAGQIDDPSKGQMHAAYENGDLCQKHSDDEADYQRELAEIEREGRRRWGSLW